MYQNCVDTQKLFAKNVPITIKDGFTNQCRKSTLFVTVEWKDASAAPINKQELLISLTDNSDPFFLYHLHLSEEDFQVLKSSQGVLVDFAAFPQKFIEFIEICLAEEDKASPKFILILNTNEKVGSISPTCQLDVVETNPFRHLTHLMLKFIAATDSAVKQYLAFTLKKLKEDKQNLESKLGYLEQDSRSRLSSTQASLEQKTQELERLRLDLSAQLTLRETKHAKDVQEERDRLLNKQRELEIRFDHEKKEKEYKHDKEKQQLEKRVSCLDTLNKELKDQNRRKDATIEELKTYKSSLEDEIHNSKEIVQEYKEKIHDLQSELKQNLAEISQQKSRIEDLENNSAYLKNMLNKLQQQYENNRQQEKDLEAKYLELQREYDDCEKVYAKKLKEQERDINKGIDVIKKLQRQITASHEEVKDMHSYIDDLKRNISSKDKTIRSLQKEIKDYQHNVEDTRYEMERILDSNHHLEEKIVSLETKVKARDDVIKHLNRQFLDKCIAPQFAPSSNQEQYSPTIVDKRHSAGDAEIIDLVQNASLAAVEKPKPSSVGNGNSANRLQNNANRSPNTLPHDSAYSSSPSGNMRTTSKSLNSNSNNSNPPPGNFELDSAALSAAFGNSDVLKHSTAKKTVNARTGKAFRGRK